MHPVAGDIELLRDKIGAIAPCDAWALARRAAEGGPPRRFLPTAGNRRVNRQASLVLAVLRLLLDAVSAGLAQAEPLLLFFPRLFLAKGTSPAEQLQTILKELQPAPMDKKVADPVQGWLLRLRASIEEPAQAKLAGLLERGPEAHMQDPAADLNHAALLQALFPPVQEGASESSEVSNMLDAVPDATGRVHLTAKIIRGWAACHRTSHGGMCGWTGSLLLALDAADRQQNPNTPILDLLAENWSRAPHEWLDARTVATALRTCDGWLIQRKGKDPRPIAAPQVIRRIRCAVDAKAARCIVTTYCEPKGQLGASGDAQQLCYTLVPQLVVHTGGTTVSADRSSSFQSFDRPALMAACKATVAQAVDAGKMHEAAALTRLACDALFDRPELPRTAVVFDSGTVQVSSLPQGCTLSPLLEALTLAGAIQEARVPHGALVQGNHDDLQLSWYGHMACGLQLPDTKSVGGSYNASKAVAVGMEAGEAVQQAGLAATAVTATTVWGRPVGDVHQWLTTVWMPKWATRIENIRRIARLDADLAIACAVKTGGPGAAARHWMRGTPPLLLQDERVAQELHSIDRVWVGLLVELAGGQATPSRIAKCHQLVFSDGGMGQQSAVAVAKEAPHQAVERCIHALINVAHERGFDPRPWGKLLCLSHLSNATNAILSHTERARIQEEASDNAVKAVQARPASTATPNLFAMALKDPGELGTAIHVSHVARAPRVLVYALARTLRIPIWTAIGGQHATQPPRNCACGAILISSEHGPEVDWSQQHTRSCYLDEYGDHMASCIALPPSCGFLRRHNAMVTMCASIARSCAIKAVTHDLPIFDNNGRKPADWMEEADNGKEICCDLTIVGGSLEHAAQLKDDKYKKDLEAHPSYALNVVAVRTNGEFHSGAAETLNRWSKQYILTQHSLGKPAGNSLTNVSAAFARAFTATMAYQARTYYRHMTGALQGRARSNKRMLRYRLSSATQETIHSITRDATVTV